jgi:hypothetical protein
MKLSQTNYVRYAFLLVCLICGCNHPKSNMVNEKQNQSSSKPADQKNSFQVNNIWVTAKPELEFNSIDRAAKDTLSIAICGEFVYSPFGIIEDSMKIQKSLLKSFNMINKIDTSNGEKIFVQSLRFKSSKLLLFFDKNPEAEKGSYIIKGEIYDPEVQFDYGVRIGMSKSDFYKAFFTNFPDVLQKQLDVFCLESCIMGLQHIYTFKNNKLSSVRFECVECSWKVDY